MSEFRELSPVMLASPQIRLADIAEAKSAGVTLIINNRPDGEDPAAPQGGEIEDAASSAGLDYIAIPVGHSGFSEPQIAQMLDAIENADGKVLAYCRSGTRSTFLWSLAQAKKGMNPESIVTAAENAGYNVTQLRPMLDMLSGQAKG
ncbi:MAG: TIGR01244 family sulfur transferase [Erythrobacter sp.]